MEKPRYLRNYSKTIELIAFSDLGAAEKAKFPLYLSTAFTANDAGEKLNRILIEWKKFDYQFRSTTAYLEENLIDVEAIRNNGELSTLYSIKNAASEADYYEGKLTLPRDEYAAKQPLWNKLPASVKDVYEKLHNGWYYFASQSMGISPVENILNLADEDSGILDEIDVAALPFKLENCLGVFHNGMGDYVCLDMEADDKQSGFIW